MHTAGQTATAHSGFDGIQRLLDEAGKVTGFVGMALDISALKAAEESLQQKNRELNTFFEGALDLHCICDSNGKLLKINRAFQTALGYSETELLAIPFLQLVHTEEQSFVLQHLLSDILHQPVRNQINRFRKKTVVTGSLSGTPSGSMNWFTGRPAISPSDRKPKPVAAAERAVTTGYPGGWPGDLGG
jgi:PAS domain S-box-containing protein